jgi:predicted Zn-dependent peptidase
MDSDFYRRTVLPNGIRILTSAMPATRSAAVSLYVGAGSRYEREEEAGLSHFLEHLLFKGSEKRPTAKDIAEAVDCVGGIMNGGTDRELTVYYVKVARPHLDLALDVLVDLVRRPLLDPASSRRSGRWCWKSWRWWPIRHRSSPTCCWTPSSGRGSPWAATSPAPRSPSPP